jgi:arsenate reductase (glutaredoxin)
MRKDFTMFHNPRCTKSRETLALLRENGIEPQVVEYLKTFPGKEELILILMKLNLKPQDILRKNEAIFKENFKNLNLSDEEWLQVLMENPILMERPIVVRGNKAVVGRPPDKVLELI